MRYIALLRGVNVGGHIVKMDGLRQAFDGLGLGNVRSYIQSGNVFFDSSELSEEKLNKTIEARLLEVYGFAIPVCLRSVPEMETIVNSKVFADITVTPDIRLCVLYTSTPLPTTLGLPIRSPKGDMEIVGTSAREAFIIWHIINGRPPAADAFIRKTLGVTGTTRFFHTSVKILDAAKQEQARLY